MRTVFLLSTLPCYPALSSLSLQSFMMCLQRQRQRAVCRYIDRFFVIPLPLPCSVPCSVLSPLGCSDLCCVLWAMATIRHQPGTKWLDAHCQVTMPRLPHLSEQQLVDVAWALAVLGHHPGPAWLGMLDAVLPYRYMWWGLPAFSASVLACQHSLSLHPIPLQTIIVCNVPFPVSHCTFSHPVNNKRAAILHAHGMAQSGKTQSTSEKAYLVILLL